MWLARGSMRLTRAGAQAVGQAIDELRGIGARAALQTRGERTLLGARLFRLHGGEHHDVDAEAGIDGRQLLAEQRRHVLGHPGRRAQAGARLGDGAVGAVERQAEAARAEPARAQVRAQFLRQDGRLGFELLGRDERIGPGALHVERRRLGERAARLGAHAQRLIETRQHGFGALRRAEAALQGGTRQAVELADAAQAEALQQQHGLRRQTQGFDRQRSRGAPRRCLQRQSPARARSGRARARRRAYRRGRRTRSD